MNIIQVNDQRFFYKINFGIFKIQRSSDFKSNVLKIKGAHTPALSETSTLLLELNRTI